MAESKVEYVKKGKQRDALFESEEEARAFFERCISDPGCTGAVLYLNGREIARVG